MAKRPKCALNLRGFPSDLKWECREQAASEKKTLGQFVEAELRKALRGKPKTKPKGT
jgi:hypothetical protein